jgi:hypothetical protein
MDTALNQPPIHIGGVEVPAGEHRLIDLSVPHLYTQGPRDAGYLFDEYLRLCRAMAAMS